MGKLRAGTQPLMESANMRIRTYNNAGRAVWLSSGAAQRGSADSVLRPIPLQELKKMRVRVKKRSPLD
ncbi:MAG TPA: hypothetical protein VK603_07780 [Candidatus Saccharimonadales bacterium]|nr:hypothetical protein [Candidatus Saccharimonadales bacterium]